MLQQVESETQTFRKVHNKNQVDGLMNKWNILGYLWMDGVTQNKEVKL